MKEYVDSVALRINRINFIVYSSVKKLLPSLEIIDPLTILTILMLISSILVNF